MKRKVLLIVTGLLLAAAVWLLIENQPASDGPVYQGKTAWEWLGDVWGANQEQAFEAFRQMGSNAVPFLVHELQKKDSTWRRFYTRNYPKLPQAIRKHLTWPVDDAIRWEWAKTVLVRLNANAAIPDLTHLLTESNGERQRIVLEALGNLVGPRDTNCIPQLINFLGSTNFGICWDAMAVLERIGPDPRTIPALTSLTNSTNLGLHYKSMWLLEQANAKMAAENEMTVKQQPLITNSQPDLRGK